MENNPCLDDLPITMVIFHSYVKLPKGIVCRLWLTQLKYPQEALLQNNGCNKGFMGESASLRYIQTKKTLISWKLSIVFMYILCISFISMAKRLGYLTCQKDSNLHPVAFRFCFPKEAADLQIQSKQWQVHLRLGIFGCRDVPGLL